MGNPLALEFIFWVSVKILSNPENTPHNDFVYQTKNKP